MKSNTEQKYQFFNFQQKQNIQTIQSWLQSTDRFRPLVLRGREAIGREYLLNTACYQEEFNQRPFTVFTIDNNQISDDIQTTVEYIENKHSFDEKDKSLWKELTSLLPDAANLEDDFYGTTVTLNLAVTTKLLKVFANHFQTKQLKATASNSEQQLQDSIELATQESNLVVHIKNSETSIHTLSMWQRIVHTLDEAARESGKAGRVLLAFSLDEYAPYAEILQTERKDLEIVELSPYTFSALKQVLNEQFINNNFSRSFLDLLLWQGAMDENSLRITSSQLFTVFLKLHEEELLHQSETGWTIDDDSPANINKILGLPLRKHYETCLETVPKDLKPAINEFMYLATLCGQWIPQHPILEAIGIEGQDQQDNVLDAIEAAFIDIDKPLLEDHAFAHSSFPELAIFQLNYPLLIITARAQFSYNAKEKHEKTEALLKHLRDKLKLEHQNVADLYWRIAQHANSEIRQEWKNQLAWHIHPHAMPYFQRWLHQKYRSDRDYAALLLQATSELLSPTADKYLDLIVSVAEKHYQEQGGYPLTQAMADSLHEIGVKYRHLGRYSKAQYFLEAALEVKQVISKELDIAHTLNSLGVVYSAQGEYKKALKYDKKVKKIWRKLLPEDHPDIALNLSNIGLTYSTLGKPEKALKYLKQTLTIQEKVLPEGHPNIAISLNNIGSSYRDLGKPGKALKYYKQALTIMKKVLPEDHPDIALALNNIGSTYNSGLGKPEKALEYHKQALAIRKKRLPESHPDIAYSLYNIGMAYNNFGKPKISLKHLKQALAILEKAFPEGHPDIARSLNGIGSNYSALGNPEKALKYQKQALTIIEKVLPEDHPDITTSLYNISESYHALKNPEKDLEYKKQALAIMKKVLPEDHPNIAIVLNNIALNYSNLNKLKEAIKFYKNSWAIWKKNLPKEHSSNIAITLQSISETYEKLNKPKKALKYKEILRKLGFDSPDTE